MADRESPLDCAEPRPGLSLTFPAIAMNPATDPAAPAPSPDPAPARSPSAGWGVDPARIAAIAKNTFLEIVRARVLYLLGFYALVMVLALVLLPQIAAGNSAGKVLLDLGLGLVGLVGLVVVAFVGAGAIDREIEKRTIFLLVAKPLSRAEFLLGKHLGLVAVLAVLVAVMTAGTLLAMVAHNARAVSVFAFDLGSVVLSGVFAAIELSLLAAVALLFGSFTSSLLASLLTLAVYLMGHISRSLLTIGIQLDDPNIQRLTEGLYLVLPDLERLNLRNLAAYGILPDPATLAADAIYGLLYTAVLLCLTAFIFGRRQF